MRGRIQPPMVKGCADGASGARVPDAALAPRAQVEPSVQKLYDYILERGTIHSITEYNHELLLHGDVSKRVTESIRTGTADWESLVRARVAGSAPACGSNAVRWPRVCFGRG